MQRVLSILSLGLLGFVMACGGSFGGDTQTTVGPQDRLPFLQRPFVAAEYVHEPVPARQKGRDNYKPTGSHVYGSNEFHNSGADCLRCHVESETAKAEHVPFMAAGTVYKDLLGSEPLAGAEVVLLDSAGGVIAMTTNAAGNFMTQTEIAVVAGGDPHTGNRPYKAWVIGPDAKVLPMVTVTGGSCNTHHTPANRRGALWAGRWSAAPAAAAAEPVSYTRHVAPIFAAKCTPCHVPAPDAEKLLDRGTEHEIDYTAGFDLVQYDSIMDDEVTPPEPKTAPSGRPFLNLSHPQDSLILAKMLGPETSHGGGRIATSRADRDYQTILRWIQAGANNDAPHADEMSAAP